MLPFVEDLRVENLHVQAPTEIVFICGGQLSLDGQVGTQSMRDAFLRISEHPALGDRNIILAEHVTKLAIFAAYYDDLLEFETHLAQITELILLFCESAGSYAELGSFAATPEIAERLLVIIRDYYWAHESFIKLGPLMNLINNHSRSAVFVVEDRVIGIVDGSPSAIDLDQFKNALNEPLAQRLATTREPSTFDPGRPGHVIKLMVGLLQEYGALEFSELANLLPIFQVHLPEKRLRAFLLCATAVGWVTEKSKGSRDFLIACDGEQDAAVFVAPEGAQIKNRRRRRMIIRAHWLERDPPRMRAIQETVAESIGGE